MRKIFIGSCLAVFLLSCSGCQNETNLTENQSMMPHQVVARSETLDMIDDIKSAVVGISAIYDDGYAIGSGVAVEGGEYILTNNHVVEGGKNLTLYFVDEQTSKAKLLWSDPNLDIAILKSDRRIPYLAFGNTQDLRVGEDVFAIGTPLTLQFKQTVTKGIVSAKDRVVEVESEAGDSFMQSLIQHDASINPGNSGGPLVNSNGEIVGINTLKASTGEGIGFAIPCEIGQKLAQKIRENENFKLSYMGIFGFDSEIAKVYGAALSDKGVYVISSTGPSKNILQKGDLITKIGDKEIEKLLDLRLAMFDFYPGQEVSVEILRNGENLTKTLKLGKK